jgi:ankyrin repeat protein
MPYGNVLLKGATLLHAAVEFGELEILDLLMERGANLNAPSQRETGNSKLETGPTPIFHAIATNQHANLPTLKHILKHYADKIDFTVRASFILSDDATIENVTPLEYAQTAAREETPTWRRATEEEIQLLRQSIQP